MTEPQPIEPEPQPTDPKTDSGKRTLTGVALWAAIGALVVWLGFTVFLMFQADSEELVWTRLAWVFGSVQAIAFAAAGALFGTAVQRENVERAEDRADTAEEVAEANRSDATKGRALAASLQADAAGGPASGDAATFDEVRGMDVPSGGSSDAVDRYAAMSRSLFGDLIE